ncbi:hypothetical protein CDAR_440671 [Caerostris darwini]|uniref:Uncharacterized protein n=1 Tax=Caerostris darwini TaxID=1538125 RepID=A0AAV4MKH2_9ARAC|nr:hypothetical protein CDAR_440671 [Caerostris darwini]
MSFKDHAPNRKDFAKADYFIKQQNAKSGYFAFKTATVRDGTIANRLSARGTIPPLCCPCYRTRWWQSRSFCALLNSCCLPQDLDSSTQLDPPPVLERGKTGKLILFIALQKRAQSGLTHPGF